MQDFVISTEMKRGPFFSEEAARKGVPDGAKVIRVEGSTPFNLVERAKEWDHEPSPEMLDHVGDNGMLTIYWVTFQKVTTFENE